MSEATLRQTIIEGEDTESWSVAEEGGLSKLPGYLDEAKLKGRFFIMTDTNVGPLYADEVADSLSDAGFESKVLEPMPAGEENKKLSRVGKFADELSNNGANRSDIIVALGGGVVGDLVGFTAATYNRGLRWIPLPTDVLAIVDASIGGKTAVDLDEGGKNKMGAFWLPALVAADPVTLKTVSERVYKEGFGEIVKTGFIEADFLPELEANAENLRQFSEANLPILHSIIGRAVNIKVDVVAADPREKNRNGGRIFLNYGHTLGHGLESATEFKGLLHGEAVAIGMMYAAQLAVRQGVLEDGEDLISRQQALLETFDLPTAYDSAKYSAIDPETVIREMTKDKKNAGGGELTFVLPKAIGNMTVHSVGLEVVESTVREFLNTGSLKVS